MLELGLQPGDRCFAEYRLQAAAPATVDDLLQGS